MARTTPAGMAQLIADEGEVLRAYRDVVGVVTIGVGLTAASGVVTPRLGMTITREESRRLLALALERNYEPAVAGAMPGARPHEFDGGLSFHFNTGAIQRASWVKAWQAGNDNETRARLLAWNKAGGRVVRGLTLRRQREADLILMGIYAHGAAKGEAEPDSIEPLAVMRRGSSGEVVRELQESLRALGFYAGPASGVFDDRTEAAVRALQTAHPHLTVDGVAGPATRAQVQRMLDLRRKGSGTAATGGVGTGAAIGADQAAPDALTGVPLGAVAGGLAAVTVIALALLAWRYRDEIRAFLGRSRAKLLVALH